MTSAYPDLPLPTQDELYATAAAVLDLARGKGLTLGTAESCTGGLVAGVLTAVPGSSDVVRGGVVSYASVIKQDLLGVSRSIIDDPSVGVVSSECAEQMAKGACRVLSADACVSVTGIAGPGGEEPGKPVGTVWFGFSSASRTMSVRYEFSGSRAEVRAKATLAAMNLLITGIASQ